jgi:hypothetical protein
MGPRVTFSVICYLTAFFVAAFASSELAAQNADLKGSILQSTVKILAPGDGRAPQVLGLRAAQDASDRAYNCQAPPRIVVLPGSIAKDVSASVRNDLLAGPTRSVAYQRPEYVGELISTAIIAFEFGRIMSKNDIERATLCAAASAVSNGAGAGSEQYEQPISGVAEGPQNN